jgi:hemoglobin-like flavoprotein
VSTKALIERNLEVVTQNAPDLIARFYATLFQRNPELASLFGRRSAEAQQQMLLQAIVAVVDHLEDSAWLNGTLRALGRKHVDYGVTDAMYPMVASALIDALREASRERWDDATAQAWTGALTFVAETMIAGARDAAVAVAVAAE